MKIKLQSIANSAKLLLIATLVCGVVYTGIITLISQVAFPYTSNGSIIVMNGKKYGCELLGQQFTSDKHMWGRIMNVDVTTFKDENGKALMYGVPSNLSPASAEYEKLISQRVEKIRKANPEMVDVPIPVDLVTCSGSGLDPNISIAAAKYQAQRLAEKNNLTIEQVNDIINSCTTGKFLGIFGEECVNVLKVNLALNTY